MDASFIYYAYGIKDFECTKTKYKGNTIIHHIQKRDVKLDVNVVIVTLSYATDSNFVKLQCQYCNQAINLTC